MTQEEKQLLLKDLCARLPYGVKILHEGWNYEWDDVLYTVERVVGIDDKLIYTKVIDTHNGEEYRDDSHSIDTFDDKLFLRPMSSMTEEEKKEFINYAGYEVEESINGRHYEYYLKDFVGTVEKPIANDDAIDWLNAHHFDFRGLIEKGLAIGVTENNNPYTL